MGSCKAIAGAQLILHVNHVSDLISVLHQDYDLFVNTTRWATFYNLIKVLKQNISTKFSPIKPSSMQFH